MRSFTRWAAVAAVALSAAAPQAAQAQYTYVGSWRVGDGPSWTTNPAVYSGVEAAAFLFGGAASDYVISTIDNNPNNINFLTFLDGWGDTSYLDNPASDTFSYDAGNPGYDDPGGGSTAFSAYVCDHACEDSRYTNYAFRVDEVQAAPEPASMVLLGTGLLGVAAAARRRKVAK